MPRFLFLALSLIFSSLLFAQTPITSYIYDPNAEQREHSLDFTHLLLELSLDPAAGKVHGKVTHYFKPLRPGVDSIFLDGILMNVQSVQLNGQTAKYHVDSAGISIIPDQPLTWGQQDSLTIVYDASPRRGLYFIGWNDPHHLSRRQVWSQGEGIDNRYWIPMYDERNDKIVTELLVTFDKNYKVLSNGNLLSVKENGDGTNTWHYLITHPHAPYLTMLGIGQYDIKDARSAAGTPMHLYYYPDWKDRVGPTYQLSEAIIDFYEKEIGMKYPWDSYSQIPVQGYMFGAMENTTATIFGDFYMVDRRGVLDRTYVAVNAHEAAHQWFGDYVTARSDAHQWLQESFATYYDQLFEKEVYGQEHFDWLRRGSENGALSEKTHNPAGVGSSMAGGNQIYGKGAFVLNMLKAVVGGREAYNKAVKHYLEKFPYQNVDSHDLMIAFEESTGMQLDWFWDEWIYRGEEPHYKVTLSDRSTETELVVQQMQELTDIKGVRKGLFSMPIPIGIHYADGEVYTATYWISRQTEILRIPNPGGKKISFVLFDPGNMVLKTCSFPKSFDMLQTQALNAENILDRYDALAAMKGMSVEKKRITLIEIFHQERFFALRAEALTQLAGDSSDASVAVFREAMSDKDVAVRRAALAAVRLGGEAGATAGKGHASEKAGTAGDGSLAAACERLLTDSSYGIIEAALQKLSFAFPARIPQYLRATKGVEGNLGRNVQIKWLELAYLSSRKTSYADQLVTLTSNSYEFRTRTNAMGALRRSAYFSKALVANLADAILSANSRLSGPAGDLLHYFYEINIYKAPIQQYMRSHVWAAADAEKLAGSMGGN